MSSILEQIIKMEKEKVQDLLWRKDYLEYFQHYGDNLIEPMAQQHIAEYSRGNGGELQDKEKSPAKMASIRSSSAMTFNLLGNYSVEILPNPYFTPGIYDIAYEKQLFTLERSNAPANLDAYLVRKSENAEDKKEAIFCEMKMMEWLKRGFAPLSPAYQNLKNYFDPAKGSAAYRVFQKLIDQLTDPAVDKENGISIFKRYDAWQMFKHTLGIYNHTSLKIQFQLEQKIGHMKNQAAEKPELLQGKFDKVTLVNVVFEMPEEQIQGEQNRRQYHEMLQEEHDEFAKFREIMMGGQNRMKKLSKENCGVDFEIRYLSVIDFLGCLEKIGKCTIIEYL